LFVDAADFSPGIKPISCIFFCTAACLALSVSEVLAAAGSEALAAAGFSAALLLTDFFLAAFFLAAFFFTGAFFLGAAAGSVLGVPSSVVVLSGLFSSWSAIDYLLNHVLSRCGTLGLVG
jgi:hypothetical protein